MPTVNVRMHSSHVILVNGEEFNAREIGAIIVDGTGQIVEVIRASTKKEENGQI